MGILLCKRNCCCCCCHCCKTDSNKLNSVDVLHDVKLKVLLLGEVGSGKTEIGHALSHKARLDFESTNGAQYYRVPLTRILANASGIGRTGDGERSGQLAITEIGGNAEMQKIWSHYYVQTMGIIYCFDLSASNEDMWQTFALLQQLLRHEYVRGKPVLLVATKSQLVDSGVQLYDIENVFQLEALARNSGSSIRLCFYACNKKIDRNGTDVIAAAVDSTPKNSDIGGSLALGIQWLVKYLLDNWCILSIRIKCDESTKTLLAQQEKLITAGKVKQQRTQRLANGMTHSRRGRFWRFSNRNAMLLTRAGGRVRSHTAPPSIASITIECQEHISDSTNPSTNTKLTAIKAIKDNNASNQHKKPVPNGHIKPQIEQVTDV